ncbi:MAG: tetratricopeptide repeat protein, partial [Acidobacteriia bacterium]|nr:tetratricopeptide repeat protein [Terriglobia bacterium]
RSIYFAAAESLYARSSYEAADEALGKVLTLDPSNVNALLLRGVVASDAGNQEAAIQYLEQVPDLDSQPNALRALLRAKLLTGNREGVEAIAGKLFTVHQDISGVNSVAEWYLENQQVEEALKFYDRYSERLLARGPAVLLDTLHPLIGRIRNNPPALQTMMRLLQKTGDASHVNEVMEMLAHAYVQSGDFIQARDTYKRLSELEPENPLHVQNYRQMLGKLGEDATTRPLSAEEGAQAFMVEELVHEAPEVHQSYAPTVERAIEAALTDSELFVSYNVPAKAIAPLEAALPLAPRDVHLNQRLATLYAKAERFEDAARACRLLSGVYAEFGHTTESARYAAAAENYLSHAAGTHPVAPAPAVSAPPPKVRRQEPVAPPPVMPPPPEIARDTSTVQEFDLDLHMDVHEPPETLIQPKETPPQALHPEPSPAPAQEPVGGYGFEISPGTDLMAEPEEIVVSPAPADEIDISSEWEDMISVESEAPPPVEVPTAHEAPVAPHAAVAAHEAVPDPAVVADKIQEIQFYISQGFWDIAHAAINDLSEIAPGHPELGKLTEAVTAARAKAEELMASSRKPSPASTPAFGVEEHDLTPPPAVRHEDVLDEAVLHEEPLHEEVHPEAAAPGPLPVQPPQELPSFDDLVLEMPDDFGEIADVRPAASVAAPPVAEPKPVAEAVRPPAPKEEPSEDVLADFVLDLEESLGQDFSIDSKSKAQPKPPQVAVPVPQPALASNGSSNGQMQDAETASALSDILADLQADLQHDIGEDAVAEEEDPETHYNLGIAFKEMGLLDEAIGELQKVCHSLERGSNFSQPIQAYTWLAQCLVDKGVPEAAIRWYQRALKSSGLDLDSRCAIYYDLGAAYEASGDRKAALTNFMEVYSTNIDFRDVSTRIKALKS